MKRRKRLQLVVRFLIAERDHAILLGLICLLAMAFSLIFAQSSQAQGERLRERAEYTLGTVSVLPVRDNGLIPYPHISRLPDQHAEWLSERSVGATRAAAAQLGLQAYPRLRGALFVAGDSIAPFVAIVRDDPARAWIEEQAAELPRRRRADRRITIEEGAPLSLAVQNTDEAVTTLAVPVDAVIARDEEGRVWLDADWLWSELASRVRLPAVIGPGLAAPIRPASHSTLSSEVALLAPDQGRHFELAFEVAQLLAEHDVEVVPWPERLGSIEYGRITSRAPTARVLLFAVTALTLAGATSIAVRRRAAVSVSLRVVGVHEQEVRGIYVTEAALVALTAGVVIWGGTTALDALTGLTVAPQILRSTLAVGVLVPIAAAFFASRRQLRAPIRRMREEAVG